MGQSINISGKEIKYRIKTKQFTVIRVFSNQLKSISHQIYVVNGRWGESIFRGNS